MISKQIGERIKSYREGLKITQKELAEEIGKSVETIKKYENGSIQAPIDVIKSIAEVFGTSFDFLLLEIDVLGDEFATLDISHKDYVIEQRKNSLEKRINQLKSQNDLLLQDPQDNVSKKITANKRIISVLTKEFYMLHGMEVQNYYIKAVRRARSIKKLNLEDFAKAVGIDKDTITGYENGSIEIPFKSLDQISKALNMTHEEFFSVKEESNELTPQNAILNSKLLHSLNTSSDSHNFIPSPTYAEFLEKLATDIRFEYWDDKLQMFTPYGSTSVTLDFEKEFIEKLTSCADTIIKSMIYDLINKE